MRNVLLLMLVSLLPVATLAQADSKQAQIESQQAEIEALSSQIQELEVQQTHKKIWGRKRYWNISYSWGTLKDVDFDTKYNSKMGFVLSRGRVIYLHKKPVADMIKFGLDVGLDISYSKYKEKDNGMYDRNFYLDDDDKEKSLGLHSLDMGLAIGPSVTINPVSKLKIKVFFHVVPSYAMLIMDNSAYHSYKTNFTYGGEVTWSRVGIGIEGYTGTASYKGLLNKVLEGLDKSDAKLVSNIPKVNSKFRTNGFRLYLTLKL